MSVLAKYAKEYPKKVMILPTTVDNEISFTRATLTEDYFKFNSNLDFFGGIFDANTWGQFLTGQDERNF